MSSEKSVGISFRVTPHFKALLEAAAQREKRSLTNMLEVVLADYCQRHGIGGESSTRQETTAVGRGR